MMHVRLVGLVETARRLDEETGRLDRIKDLGAAPQVCGPQMVVAPARGPLRIMDPKAAHVGDDGEVSIVSVGFEGRKVAKVCDVFDVMEARAKAQRFTAGQIAVGRCYGALIERHSKGATKCSSLEAAGGSGGGSNGGAFMDGFLAEGLEIDAMRARAGSGVAMDPKGRKGRVIRALDLVDRVCVRQHTPAQVLRHFGWAVNGRMMREITQALGAALDRMACTAGSGRGQRIEVFRGDGVAEAAKINWAIS